MATSYSNTGGQGDRTAIITVTSNFTPQGTMSNAVDGASGNNSTDSFGFQSGVTTGNIITFDFGVGAKKTIDEFKWVQQNATSNGTWKWSWSDDNSSYTDLTTGIAIAGASSTTTVSVSAYATGARYYRLTQTGGTTTASPWVQEVTFKIDDVVAATLHAVLSQTVPAFSQTLTAATIQRAVLAQIIAAFPQTFGAVPEARSAVLVQTVPAFSQALAALLVPRATAAQTIDAFPQSLFVARIRAAVISQLINDFTIEHGAVENFVHRGTRASRFRPKMNTLQVGGRPRRIR